MDPLASVRDKIKGFVNSVVFKKSSDSSGQNPIEIVKRLHQEAFSELVKLTDRQDKVERIVSFRFGKGSPLQEGNTQLKGIINVVGFLLFGENDFQKSCGALRRAGIKTGIQPKLIFETVGQKDVLIAEFVSSHEHVLALERLMYSVHTGNLLSVASIALGAQCNNFAITTSHKQGYCPSGFSPSEPPLFSQRHSCAAGVVLKGSKITASLAELVSGIGLQHDDSRERSCLSTFGQVSYQPYEDVKVNFSGVWQKPADRFIRFGTLSIPLSSAQRQTRSSARVEASPTRETAAGSVAVMLDSEVAEIAKVGVWLEVEKSSPVLLKWGISISDVPSDELGWGLKVRGTTNGQLNFMEGFLKFNLGGNFVLQPGFACVMEGSAKTPAFILQSSWCM